MILAALSHVGAGWLLWGLVEAQQWEVAAQIVTATLTADMLFVMGAFGLDAVSRQTGFGVHRAVAHETQPDHERYA